VLNTIRQISKRLAGRIFERYALSRIYTLDLSPHAPPLPHGIDCRRITRRDLEECPVPRIRDRAGYGGPNSHGFAVYENGSIACMCWFWEALRFQEAIWRLQEGEVVMVDLLTLESCRGRGFAPLLIRYAADELRSDGWRRLVTWVWHSNTPSIRSFDKAGWKYIAFVIELQFRGSRKLWRLSRRKEGDNRRQEAPQNISPIRCIPV
jgi:GNAT superfamily N-acetyltransferase